MPDKVGSRSEIRRELTVEVAGAAGRREKMFIEILRTVRRRTTMISINPTFRDEVSMEGILPIAVLNITRHILVGSGSRVPAFNDLCQMGWTQGAFIIGFGCLVYG